MQAAGGQKRSASRNIASRDGSASSGLLSKGKTVVLIVFFCLLCLNSREPVFQIGQDVVDMLRTNGQADGVGFDALIQ